MNINIILTLKQSKTVIFPLSLGIGIYWFFRGIPVINLVPIISIHLQNSRLLRFLIYSLPDGLWLYALLQGMRLIWQSDLFAKGLIWLIAIPLGAMWSEVAQYYHIIPGTFDFNDITAYIIATSCFLVQYLINPQTSIKSLPV